MGNRDRVVFISVVAVEGGVEVVVAVVWLGEGEECTGATGGVAGRVGGGEVGGASGRA